MNKRNAGKRYAFHHVMVHDAKHAVIEMRDEDTLAYCGTIYFNDGNLILEVAGDLRCHAATSAWYALERGWKALQKRMGCDTPTPASIARAMRRSIGAEPHFAIPVPMMAYGKGRGGRGQYSRGA